MAPSENMTQVGITITFRRNLEKEMSYRQQHQYTRIVLAKIFGQSCSSFTLVPEFTLSGRIHYHGYFKIKNKGKWIKDTLPILNKLGFIKLEFNLTNKWFEYILKDVEETRNIIGYMSGTKISIDMDNYNDWKLKQPKLEDFDITSKTIHKEEPLVLPSSYTGKWCNPDPVEYVETIDGKDYYRTLNSVPL